MVVLEMRGTERKCDTCTFNSIDRFGDFCDNPRNKHEYGLRSVYGWCEYYAKYDIYKSKREKTKI